MNARALNASFDTTAIKNNALLPSEKTVGLRSDVKVGVHSTTVGTGLT